MLVMARRKMKRPYSAKIPGRSVPEVTGRYEALVSRQGGVRGLKFFGSKVTAEAVTSAIVLHFLSLTQEEQDAAFDRFVPEFEGMLRLDVESEKPAERGAGFVTTIDLPVPEGRTVTRPASPRKRKNGGA